MDTNTENSLIRILVLDDDNVLRQLEQDILESRGYEVVCTSSGEEAVSVFEAAHLNGMPFAAVILDLTIEGGLGGKDTLICLKEIDPDVRAIAVSGYTSDAVMSNPAGFGFETCLLKPFQIQDFLRLLGAVVER